LKHNAVAEVLRGRRVVVVDDSIVRGTTSRKIVKMLRSAGAREVHLRISSPQISWPCFYGIDTPTRSELIAQSHTVDEINQYLTSDTLAYLSLDETQRAVLDADEAHRAVAAKAVLNGHAPALNGSNVGGSNTGASRDRFCHACFSGDYPVAFQDSPKPRQMRLLDI
jgi:amidophosphoribosyltransferase